MKYKEKQILEILWIDTIIDSGWKSKESFDKEERNSKWLWHYSIGYFLCEDKETITIMQSYTNKEGDYNTSERLSIPRVSIKKIKRL